MKKIALLITLLSGLVFAGEAKTSVDSLILKPSKEQLAKATPLNNTICPITNEKIGSMGNAVPVIYKGKIVNLCCNGCPADFAKNPEKYMKLVYKEVGKKDGSSAAKPAPAKDNMQGMDHSSMHK